MQDRNHLFFDFFCLFFIKTPFFEVFGKKYSHETRRQRRLGLSRSWESICLFIYLCQFLFLIWLKNYLKQDWRTLLIIAPSDFILWVAFSWVPSLIFGYSHCNGCIRKLNWVNLRCRRKKRLPCRSLLPDEDCRRDFSWSSNLHQRLDWPWFPWHRWNR